MFLTEELERTGKGFGVWLVIHILSQASFHHFHHLECGGNDRWFLLMPSWIYGVLSGWMLIELIFVCRWNQGYTCFNYMYARWLACTSWIYLAYWLHTCKKKHNATHAPCTVKHGAVREATLPSFLPFIRQDAHYYNLLFFTVYFLAQKKWSKK